jgi:iron complex outermembrane recepter protein
MKTRYASLRVLALLGAGAAFAPAAAMAQDQTDTDLIENADVVDSNVIVVTAQGRAQVLADVPVAINAVSAEQLERSGTNDIRELTQVAPSLLVSSTGNEANGSARIRGIGTVGDNPGSKARSRCSSTGSTARVRAMR